MFQKKVIDWSKKATETLKESLDKRNISYPLLSQQLGRIGVVETSANLSNKVNRGTFSFSFYLQVLKALDLIHTVEDASLQKVDAIALGEEDFINSYMKLSKVYQDNTNEESSEYFDEKLQEAHIVLLNKLGLSKSLIENILNEANDDWSYYKMNLSKEDVKLYYDYLMEEKRSINEVDSLIGEIEEISMQSKKEFSLVTARLISNTLFLEFESGNEDEDRAKDLRNLKIKTNDIYITKNTCETVQFIENIKEYLDIENSVKLKFTNIMLSPPMCTAIYALWEGIVLCHRIIDSGKEQDCEKKDFFE